MDSTGTNSVSGGAIILAVTSGLCCILPLLSVVFGISALGAASIFETLRPYLLTLSFFALAVAFYATYFWRRACAEDGSCLTKPAGRISQLILWCATIAVLAFALLPFYTGYLASALVSNPGYERADLIGRQGKEKENRSVTIRVKGMTCEGCATMIDEHLNRLKGVVSSNTSYRQGKVRVVYDPKQISIETIKKAIRDLGYTPE